MELTVDALKDAKFKGPVRFSDGYGGMARQDFECVDEPRFGYFWQRENRKDKGRQAYTVDGTEVASLDDACRLLALPPDPSSPAEAMKRHIEEFRNSPKLEYGATRALSEARCNADTGPFGMIRAFMHRAGGAYHGGINKFADFERQNGREFPHWLYRIKDAAHEVSRLMYLFDADRKEDTGLRCALGKACRSCPILTNIEAAMVADRTGPFPHGIEDFDIDAAKSWTCVHHVLAEKVDHLDGGFLCTKRDRESGGLF